ncbi:hypothetical protein [Aquibium oceanicum]|uniref:Uncharacterized protein n=1 Tax=Aquibium oceanicum TaxID=1670800 RepID=A0A1L3SSH0_9HYPH|nr:hypothetical protein [Aquibium oceanicum]APH72275.1 hypothetical protein BSQ44_13560 [Aquibium oceanicum]
METFPIAIFEDRYTGVYSGGRWLAVASATDGLDGKETRIGFCLESDDGPSGSDVEAATFWVDPPLWIAVGGTPDEALANLRNTPK